MFQAKLFKGKKLISSEEFETVDDAFSSINEETFDDPMKYEIYDIETKEIVESGELECTDDIDKATRIAMFPNDDDEDDQGFDVDKFWDNEQ